MEELTPRAAACVAHGLHSPGVVPAQRHCPAPEHSAPRGYRTNKVFLREITTLREKPEPKKQLALLLPEMSRAALMVSMAIAIISAQKRFAAHRPPVLAHDGFPLKPALIVSHTCGVCNLSSQGSTSFRVLRLFSGAFLPIESKHSGALLFWPYTGITSRWQETVPEA